MMSLNKHGMNENGFENWLVGICGLMGGGIHYTMLQVAVIETPFWQALIKAAITAFICAFFGMTAKYAFNKIFKNKP